MRYLEQMYKHIIVSSPYPAPKEGEESGIHQALSWACLSRLHLNVMWHPTIIYQLLLGWYVAMPKWCIVMTITWHAISCAPQKRSMYNRRFSPRSSHHNMSCTSICNGDQNFWSLSLALGRLILPWNTSWSLDLQNYVHWIVDWKVTTPSGYAHNTLCNSLI